ncbi:MAG: sensor histidine kinase [Pseudoxanthomonas suwonensis]|nr:sensor histidine kinase [Pseudoxanthomonas suwonensis]
MFTRLDPSRLLHYAGLFTWAVVALPLLLLEPAAAALGWEAWLAWLVFGLSYTWLTRGLGQRRVRMADYLLLLPLNASAIAFSFLTGTGLAAILLMVAASVLPWMLSLRAGLAVLLLSESALVLVFTYGLHFPPVESMIQTAVYLGVTGFVFATSLVGRQQAQARDEQHRLNAELRATRALLAESVRVNERTRIARELHDLLGHHLTALSLNLEVAGHLVDGKALEHVGQAHTLAKLLLSDVREAVSQIREADRIDMAATLAPLARNVPGLRIDLDTPEPFWMDDPEHAHVLLRCTQEIVTNAVRHAQASRLSLAFRVDGTVVRLHARDDGRGADHFALGNGLRGMRERLDAHGGTLEVRSAPGAGFVLDIVLPLHGATMTRRTSAQELPA